MNSGKWEQWGIHKGVQLQMRNTPQRNKAGINRVGYNGVDNMLTIPLPSIPLAQSTQQEQSLFTIKHHYATQHDTQHDTHIETSPLRALALTPQAKARYLQ